MKRNQPIPNATTAGAIGLAAAAAVLWAPAPAEAFSISNHVQVTQAALQQIRACVAGYPKRWAALRVLDDPAITSALVGCDIKQDEIARKFALWHFYANDVAIKGTFLQGNAFAGSTSFDAFYKQLSARLDQSIDPPHAYATAGALLHYVQDAAVPAHAVPIFHPKPLWNGDNFDEFPFQSSSPAADEATCARLLDESAAPAQLLAGLLSAVIGSTMAAVRSDIPAALITVEGKPAAVARVPRTWTLFWDTNRGADGFGKYGCVGDKFGKVSAMPCGGSWLTGAARVVVQREAYLAFAAARQRTAVEASVKVIAAAARKAGHAAPTIVAVVCPVAKPVSGGHVEVCEDALSGPGDLACAEDE